MKRVTNLKETPGRKKILTRPAPDGKLAARMTVEAEVLTEMLELMASSLIAVYCSWHKNWVRKMRLQIVYMNSVSA